MAGTITYISSAAPQATVGELQFTVPPSVNLLVGAIWVAPNTDVTAFPATLTDSIGNVFNLIVSETNFNPAIALYICNSISNNGVSILTFTGFGAATNVSTCGYVMETTFSTFTPIGIASQTMSIIDDAIAETEIVIEQTESVELFFSLTYMNGAGPYDTLAAMEVTSAVGPVGLPTNNFTQDTNFINTNTVLGWNLSFAPLGSIGSYELSATASNTITTGLQSTVSISLSGILTGATGNPSRAFFLSRAPEPKIPKPSRSIATVIVDCTQMNFNLLANVPLQLPEMTLTSGGNSGITAWSTYEFDLEHVGNVGGLDQVRKLIAYSRLSYGSPSVSGQPQDGQVTNAQSQLYALLTNTTTLQTEVLGGNAIQQALIAPTTDEVQALTYEKLHVSFPAHHGAMKFRFLALSNVGSPPYGVGIHTLLFLNFDDGQGSVDYCGGIQGNTPP